MSTPPHAAPIAHYENFPVASWLCPPNLRAPIAAIYHFARTADDIADEGDAPAAERLADLAAYRQALHAAARGSQAGSRWPGVFDALAYAIQAFHLPVPLLEDLLDAFVQDVGKTRDGAGYTDQAELLDYCRRSANPIGRLLLHLYGVADLESLRMSDAICSALQLVNFWQDLSRDIPRGRFYLPEADCAAHGVDRAMLAATSATPAVRELVAAQAAIAQALMLQGAPLVHRVPGRAGWELRLVVQGGLRILERIARQRFDTLCQRPHIGGADAPVLLWRALRM